MPEPTHDPAREADARPTAPAETAPADAAPAEPTSADAAPASAVPAEVQAIVDALDDKRALDVAVLHLEEVSDTLDWFVVATGESSLQLQAMEGEVRERLKATGARLKAVEGPSARWVLMDYGGVVAHLMSPEARAFYDLEGLWADAPRVPVVAS